MMCAAEAWLMKFFASRSKQERVELLEVFLLGDPAARVHEGQ